MKSMMKQTAASLLVLAAIGMPYAAQASDTTNFTVSATVEETFSVDQVKNVTLDFAKGTTDVEINIQSNVPNSTTPATVTVSAVDKNGDGFNLKGPKDQKLKVKAELEKTVFSNGQASISTAKVGTPVKLHLTPDTPELVGVGEYTGTLNVKVSKP
ncbi:hypothetical protein [Serratia marcescens]|uniref:hypothetical protein n=1 Tax=Serratia marcescens TaxID=615 RepID=UPI0013D93E77|nr:hypothetical protein [Serratia marcescens]